MDVQNAERLSGEDRDNRLSAIDFQPLLSRHIQPLPGGHIQAALPVSRIVARGAPRSNPIDSDSRRING